MKIIKLLGSFHGFRMRNWKIHGMFNLCSHVIAKGFSFSHSPFLCKDWTESPSSWSWNKNKVCCHPSLCRYQAQPGHAVQSGQRCNHRQQQPECKQLCGHVWTEILFKKKKEKKRGKKSCKAQVDHTICWCKRSIKWVWKSFLVEVLHRSVFGEKSTRACVCVCACHLNQTPHRADEWQFARIKVQESFCGWQSANAARP